MQFRNEAVIETKVRAASLDAIRATQEKNGPCL